MHFGPPLRSLQVAACFSERPKRVWQEGLHTSERSFRITLRSSGPAPLAQYANRPDSRGPLAAVVRHRKSLHCSRLLLKRHTASEAQNAAITIQSTASPGFECLAKTIAALTLRQAAMNHQTTPSRRWFLVIAFMVIVPNALGQERRTPEQGLTARRYPASPAPSCWMKSASLA